MQEINSEILRQIQEQIEKIQRESGIETDETYQKELDDFFGLNSGQLDELDKELVDLMTRKVVKVELSHQDAVFPSYNYPTDSGFDLHSVEEITLEPFGRAAVPTGIKLGFSEGFEIQIRPKSGLALKQGLTVLNTPGTVDAGYTGEIKVIVFNTNPHSFTITKGMKIAQAVLCPVVNGKSVKFDKVLNIEEKDRGNNGFGSTGI